MENPDISVKVLSHKKTSHHQDPTSPCTLEMSALRIENSADDSMVSEGNLSDVCPNIEEYDFNKSRPTEKILDQLAETGNPHELSLEDKDLEKLLDGDSDTSLPLASTPASSPRRSSTVSPPSSMPSLVNSTSSVNDSGNSSQDHANAEINSDESPSGAGDASQLASDQTPNQDAVKINFERVKTYDNKNLFNCATFRKATPLSEPRSQKCHSRSPPRIETDINDFIKTYVLTTIIYSRILIKLVNQYSRTRMFNVNSSKRFDGIKTT